jgi:DNA-binding CsgD family transcriptional regulator
MADKRPIELRTTLERVSVPSVIVDSSGTVTWANGAASSVFGDGVGKHLLTYVAEYDRPRVQAAFDRKLRGERATDYEADFLTRSGLQRADVSSVLIPGGDDVHCVFGLIRAVPTAEGRRTVESPLTPRQLEVLALLSSGASTQEIAELLHISRETVRNHVRHILQTLRVHSRVEAVAVAHREGWVS